MENNDQPTNDIHEIPARDGQGLAPMSGSAWLPIESAPKDGTTVIVGYDFASVWIVHLAWWRNLEEWQINDPEWNEDDIGWWSYVENSVSQHKLDEENTPTHWLPCPPLPSAEPSHR